jgi:hypothetical protein
VLVSDFWENWFVTFNSDEINTPDSTHRWGNHRPFYSLVSILTIPSLDKILFLNPNNIVIDRIMSQDRSPIFEIHLKPSISGIAMVQIRSRPTIIFTEELFRSMPNSELFLSSNKQKYHRKYHFLIESKGNSQEMVIEDIFFVDKNRRSTWDSKLKQFSSRCRISFLFKSKKSSSESKIIGFERDFIDILSNTFKHTFWERIRLFTGLQSRKNVHRC